VKGYSPGSSQTVSLNGATGFSITEVIGESADDWLGAGVAAGDFNGDGFDDLVLGAPGPINEWFEDISPTNSPFNIDVDDDRPGRLYIIEGFTTLFNTSEINLSTTGLDHIVITGDYDRGQFGRTVAIGNVDNDSGGRADILVGARDHGIAYSGNPFNVGSHVPGDGKAYVIHGSASITSDFTISSPPSGARVTEILAANPEDSLGESAGLADVNGDGFEDILLGAPFAERAAGTGDLSTLRVGEAYIIYGGPCLPDEIDFSAGEQGTLILGMHPGEWTGTSVESLGDLNNDGFVDLTVGAGFGNALSASGPFDVDSEEISDGDKTGFMATILGAGEANGSALTTLATAAGNAPPTEFGPVVRATLDYTGGSNTSGTTATLTRTKSGVTGITLADVADVRWKIETNRTGWSTATLTLEYLDSEVSGLVENDLYIYRAANLSGPWSQLTSGRTVQPSINRISSTIASSQLDGHFILVEVAPDPKQ
jgi:hypothetical protein